MTSKNGIIEARTQSRPLATPKESMKVGCWNVRTIFSLGKTAQIVMEARRYPYSASANVDGQVLDGRGRRGEEL